MIFTDEHLKEIAGRRTEFQHLAEPSLTSLLAELILEVRQLRRYWELLYNDERGNIPIFGKTEEKSGVLPPSDPHA